MFQMIQTTLFGGYQLLREKEQRRYQELQMAHKRLKSEYNNNYKKKDLDILDNLHNIMDKNKK